MSVVSLLKQKIIERIQKEGPISFESFMEMALYYPGLGYYMREHTAIGRAGDFYTSSHLHPLFGALLGRQMEEMWHVMGRPDSFAIVEMGAGMGYLAQDMLGYLKKSADKRRTSAEEKGFFRSAMYTIVEMNPAMKGKQQELLADFRDKVRWVSRLQELGPVTGCFLSNELLDAFPVRIVEKNHELNEIFVSVIQDEIHEIKNSCSNIIKQYFKLIETDAEAFPEGYRTEVNLKIRDWLSDIGSRLIRGFLLTIDYGYPAFDYYSEERNRGTLLCYHKHHVYEDPYLSIGEQDITAHVDFTALRRWGEELGLRTLGYCTQGTYLVSLGMDEVITELYGGSPDPFEIAKIKGLILPQGMGESHKVMIQYKGEGKPILRGFGLRNDTRKL